jgi:hypothetical protein
MPRLALRDFKNGVEFDGDAIWYGHELRELAKLNSYSVRDGCLRGRACR